MVKSLDGLIRHLLEEIAVAGARGVTVPEILQLIQGYYTENCDGPLADATAQETVAHAAADGTEATATEGGPADQAQGTESPEQGPPAPRFTQNIDRSFLAHVWQWLIAQPDVLNGDGQRCERISLDEAEKLASINEEDPAGTEAGGEGSSAGTGAQLRLRVTEDRIWLALTGHSPDLSRCPRLEFACLLVIAAHGQAGIHQGDLIRLTGQDKRSLPKRTHELARKGYIEKKVVFFRRQRTSHLRLRRYANCSVPAAVLKTQTQVPAGEPRSATAAEVLKEDVLEAEPLIKTLFAELKQRQMMTQRDLKWKLGIPNQGSRLGIYKRLIKKLELIGCIRRLRARSDEAGGSCIFSCIKYLREPNKDEWRLPWDLSVPVGVSLYHGANPELDADGENDEDEAQGGSLASTNGVSSSRDRAGRLQEVGRVLPQWRPGRPMGCMLREAVEAAGIEGISTMALKARTVGTFYNRPLEVAVERYSNFDLSQPPHLRHLAIIRDTAQHKRTYHYQHYSYDSFQELVNRGQASWEAVTIPAERGKGNGGNISNQSHQNSEEDDYGFATFDSSRFTGEDGCARLDESVNAADMVGHRYTSYDPVLYKSSSGQVEIEWGIVKGEGRKSRRQRTPDQPRRPLGRPRKYAPGEAPPRRRKPRKGEQNRGETAADGSHAVEKPAKRGRPSKKRTADAAQLDGDSAAPADSQPVAKKAKKGRAPKPQTADGAQQAPPKARRGRSSKQATANEAQPVETGSKGGNRVDKRTAEEARLDENDCIIVTPEDPSGPEPSGLAHATQPQVAGQQKRTRINAASQPRTMPQIVQDGTILPAISAQDSRLTNADQGSPNGVQLPKPANSRARSSAKSQLPTHHTIVWEHDLQDKSTGTDYGGGEASSSAGAPGTSQVRKQLVLINPPGYKKPRTKKMGRPRKAFIAVFKFDRLRELPWFPAPAPKPTEGPVPAETASDDAPPRRSPTTQDIMVVRDEEVRSGRPDLPAVLHDSARVVEEGVARPLEVVQHTAQARAPGTACPRAPAPPVRRENVNADMNPRPAHDVEMVGSQVADPRASQANASNRGVSGEPRLQRPLSMPQNGPAKRRPERRSRKRIAIHERGSINFKRKQVVQNLLDKLGGVFPGDRELWYAFSILWIRQHPGNGRPDVKTVKGMQRLLIDSGQLKSFTFCFTNSKGLRSEKRILARMHIQADSPLVKDLEEKMKRSNRQCYIPPEVGISAEERKRFETMEVGGHGYLPRVKITRDNTARVTLIERPESTTAPSSTTRGARPTGPTRRRVNRPARGDKSANQSQGQRDTQPGEMTEKAKARQAEKDTRRQQRAHKRSVKFSQEIVRLSLGEQRAAARKIEEMSRSVGKGQRGHGPPRVARLHGLLRTEVGQPVVPQPKPQKFDLRSARVQEQAMELMSWISDSEVAATLISLIYKLQRTSLNAPVQTFHPSSGTFGTLYPTILSSRKKPQPALSVPPVRDARPEASAAGTSHKRPRPALSALEATQKSHPQSLEEIVQQSRKRRKTNQNLSHDPARRKFHTEVACVQEWEEQNAAAADEEPSGWTFINHTVDSTDLGQPPPTVKWTRPRGTAGVIDLVEDEPSAKRRRSQAGPPRARVVRNPIRPPPVSIVPRIEPAPMPPKPKPPRTVNKFKTRRLTAAPVDYNNNIESDIGLENGASVRHQRGPRLRMAEKVLTDLEVQRLLVSVTVVRTLTGGLNRNIDWVIVAKLFPDLNQAFLNKKWTAVAARFRSQVDKLQSDFQEAFLAAYERNEVPPIDYDDLVGYDWAGLVDWAIRNLDVPNSQRLPNLPAHRERLDECFDIQDEPQPALHWKDEFFVPVTTTLKRTETARQNPLSIQLSGLKAASAASTETEQVLARSWVRANVITAEELYRPQEAKQKLDRLGEDRVERALKELSSQKIVAHVNQSRAMPGRNYDITDHFLHGNNKGLHELQYAKAAAFKTKLDEAFRNSGSAMFAYATDDGESLALTNLVANKRVRIIPRNVPDNKFGLLDGGYRTRFMDKTRLLFDIEVAPTATYLAGNPLAPLPPPPQKHLADESVPIPVWFDIHGNFVEVMWRRVLVALLNTVPIRSGVTAHELRRCLKPSLEVYELEAALDWLVQANAAAKIDGAGYVATEWWWMLFSAMTPLGGGATALMRVPRARPRRRQTKATVQTS